MLLRTTLWLACYSILALAQINQLLVDKVLPKDPNETNIEMLKDVAYGSAHPAQKLDAYLPPADTAMGPATIVFIHGGAWRAEDKSLHEGLALDLLKQSGCPVIAINYRLSPQKTTDVPAVHHPAHALDALEALKFIQGHGSAELGIPQSTLSNLYLVGHSCGAHMITSIVLDADSESHKIDTPPSLLADIRGVFISEGIYEIDLLLKKFPSYSGFIQGAFGEHDSYKPFSPAYYKLRGESPIYWLVVHSKGDTLVDEEQAESLWDHLWELYDRKAHQYVEADWERLKVEHDEVVQVGEYAAMVSQFIRETLAKHASAPESHM